ncbi:MAG TPA: metallophosphoesterase [bacterium]|mgnify:CR=1 FL=1|nr:metallophosphoesterase [bacterium]
MEQEQADNSKSKMDRRKFISSGFLGYVGVLLSPVAVLYESSHIEPNWPAVTKYDVEIPGYPADAEPLDIVQLSDLHRGHFVSEEHIRKLVPLCNKLSPDIVVITGDFVSRKTEYAASCVEALSGLTSRIGIFGVMGNHDYWAVGKENVFKDLGAGGIRMIKNGNVELKENVWLIGIDDEWAGKPDIPKAFEGVPENAARIVMTHSPKTFAEIRDMNVFAMVGHTHGGQCTIPFVTRKYIRGMLGCEHLKGWYAEGNSRLYVNRGIGMVTPPLRFFCRPEITRFTCGPVKEIS